MSTDPARNAKLPDTPFTWKPLIMLAVVAAAFASVYFTPARNYLGNVQTVKGWLLSLGWGGPAAWMGIVFVMVASGTPRLLFCPIGGLAFGFWYGLLWTQAATLAGYYVLFLFVRWGGRDFVLRHWPRVGRLREHVHGHSAALLVFAVRQLPISGLIINLLLGLSPIRHRHFLLGTAFGILPEAVPFTLVASGVLKLSGENTPLYIVVAAGILLLVSASMWYFSRHSGLMAELRGRTRAAEDESGMHPPGAPSPHPGSNNERKHP
jgi:uncharacterized membrane protein YdjX (TVP38/TMEM64 family)